MLDSMSTYEASDRLGVSWRQLMELIDEGEVAAVYDEEDGWRIACAEVARLREQRKPTVPYQEVLDVYVPYAQLIQGVQAELLVVAQVFEESAQLETGGEVHFAQAARGLREVVAHLRCGLKAERERLLQPDLIVHEGVPDGREGEA